MSELTMWFLWNACVYSLFSKTYMSSMLSLGKGMGLASRELCTGNAVTRQCCNCALNARTRGTFGECCRCRHIVCQQASFWSKCTLLVWIWMTFGRYHDHVEPQVLCVLAIILAYETIGAVCSGWCSLCSVLSPLFQLHPSYGSFHEVYSW